MKKIMIASLVAGALALPAIATAQVGDPAGYRNHGQCQSALMRLRNEDRAAQTHYTNAEYNYYTRVNWECQQNPTTGRWHIVQVDSQGH